MNMSSKIINWYSNQEKTTNNKPMKLSDLLQDISVLQIIGNSDIEVAGIHSDSRQVKQGQMFLP